MTERRFELWRQVLGIKVVFAVIRGVNKSIIEISDTGNECFERAILFVRPDSARLDSDTLHARAAQYIGALRLRPWFYQNKITATILAIAAGAMIGATIMALLLSTAA